jgi:hypothetical protein
MMNIILNLLKLFQNVRAIQCMINELANFALEPFRPTLPYTLPQLTPLI